MYSHLTIPRIDPFAKIVFMTICIISPIFAESAPCTAALKQVLEDSSTSVTVPKKSCPQTYGVIGWLKAKRNNATFQEVATFLNEHPGWPFQETIQKNAEAALAKSPLPPAQTIAWFKKFPPVTAQGVELYADALKAVNKNEEAKNVVATAWKNLDLSADLQKKWFAKYGTHLTAQDHFVRASSLLNKDNSMGEKLISFLPEKYRQIMATRLTFKNHAQNKTSGAENGFTKLTALQQQDPGLIYDYLRYHRQLENNKAMAHIFDKYASHIDPALVVKERHILTRRFLDENNHQDAYKVIKMHGLTSGEDFANSEWLAGWIALRMLRKPDIAEKHFLHLHKNVSSPISVARATYWLGRTYEALNQKSKATDYFKKAADHPATYYGQLALEKLHGSKPKLTLKSVQASKDVAAKFNQRPFVIALKVLGAANAPEHQMLPFVLALAQSLSAQEQALLVDLAAKIGSPYFAVQATKHTAKKAIPLIPEAFPTLTKDLKPHIKGESAFVHAIIRQESRFQADAVSTAGAMGLMQIMPATGKEIARKFGVKYNKLSDKQSNVSLGSYHLKDLLGKYEGSYILAAAAYNAGADAVKKWIDTNGDPRHPHVDTCDWVEKIPYAETRNYVQRVMENLHCYRGRF